MRRTVEVRGLTFDVYEEGPAGGPAVLLLHGFPQDSRQWDLVVPRLHAAGLRTYALDQRGYSAGARPADVSAYRLSECVADVVAVLDALGLRAAHVVGHDWGANVGWLLAARHPDRVRTLTAVSVPYPLAIRDAVRAHWSQGLRLGYVAIFRRRGLAERLLGGRDGAVLRRMMAPAGEQRARRYADAMLEPGRLTGGLNWYRALSPSDMDGLGAVAVPTTYVWSTRDGVVQPDAVLRCAQYVDGDYRLVVVPRVSHWIADEAPEVLVEAVLARVAGADESADEDHAAGSSGLIDSAAGHSAARNEPGGGSRPMRHETEKQRWDRNFGDLLQELRVAQTGVQILFAFLLAMPFTNRFEETTNFQRDIYVVALMAAAFATAMIISPVAFHRALFRQGRKPELVRFAHKMATGGLAFMLVSMVSSVLLITDFLLSMPVAIVLSALAGGWFLTLWAVLPFVRRNWGEDDPAEEVYADEAAEPHRAATGR